MIKVLAIETSCDETSVSIVSNSDDIYKIHSNIVASQIEDHSKWEAWYQNSQRENI